MPTDSAVWTIDQLTERVARALAADYPGQTSGRVRDVPNIRTIRWYTTIGLLDRPAEMRGRTAYYGERHLAQIVAVKRLQADGRSLAEVQEALLGADDTTLFAIAGLVADAPDASDTVIVADGVTDPTAARTRFWSAGRTTAARPPLLEPAQPIAEPAPAPATPLVQGIPLAPDVTLLLTALSRTPDPADRAAVEEAARPLLDTLRRLGLTTY